MYRGIHTPCTGTAPRGPLPLRFSLAIGLLLALLIPSLVQAQGAVRAWGMGGAHTAAARGLEAAEYNPAALAFSSGTTVGLATAAVDVHNNAFSLDRYNEITGAHLNSADKAQIMSDIPDGGLTLDADVRASVFGVQNGNYAVSFGGFGSGQGNLDKDYFDLVLYGNTPGETIDFSNTWGEGYSYGSAAVSYGHILKDGDTTRLSAGFTARYLQGIYEVHVEDAYGQLTTTMTEISGEAFVSTLSSSGGQGYGLDLGLALEMAGGLSVGLVVDNLTTRIDWTGDVEANEFRVNADEINLLNSDLDAAVTDADTTYTGEGYTTHLPRRVRVGAAKAFGAFHVAMDYVQGLETRGTTSTNPLVNAGVEWHLVGALHPRFGASVGGAQGQGLSAGLGMKLGFWRLDLAAMTRSGLKTGDTKGVAFAAGSSLEF